MSDRLFDLPEGDRRKQYGMEQAVEAPRVQPWRVTAAIELRRLIASGLPFTADDLVLAVGLPDTGQNRNNAVGGMISGAAKAGLIRRIGDRRTERTVGNARRISVWIKR